MCVISSKEIENLIRDIFDPVESVPFFRRNSLFSEGGLISLTLHIIIQFDPFLQISRDENSIVATGKRIPGQCDRFEFFVLIDIDRGDGEGLECDTFTELNVVDP